MGNNKAMYMTMRGAYLQMWQTRSNQVGKLAERLMDIFKEYYLRGEAEEGVEIIFDVGFGLYLRLVFYKNELEIFARKYNDGSKGEECFLEEADLSSAQDCLDAISKFHATLGGVMGKSCPEEFGRFLLAQVQEGDLISFEGGITYVCTSKNKLDLWLSPVFEGGRREIALDCIQECKPMEIRCYDEYRMTPFYQCNSKKLTGTVSARLVSLKECYELLQKFIKEEKGFRTIKLQLGTVQVCAKKSFNSNELRWYEGRKRVPEKRIIYLLGCLITSPIEIICLRKNPTELGVAMDENFCLEIEKELLGKAYASAYKQIQAYVRKSEGDLSVELHTTVLEESGFNEYLLMFGDNDVIRCEKKLWNRMNVVCSVEANPIVFEELCRKKHETEHFVVFPNSIDTLV